MFDANRLHRRSLRLRGYDYAQAGAYFVTICARDRACLFGEAVDERVALSDAGRAIQEVWQALPAHFPGVVLDAFVVMPNHLHAILVLTEVESAGGRVGAGSPRPYPTGAETAPLRRVALGRIMAFFKYQSAKRINEMRGTAGAPVWQRNYYERVIRGEDEMDHIRQYIADNPVRWAEDPEKRQL